ncbi:hypothetical protein BOW75_gp25 [Salmonella phage IME207]|uniref:Uncharacterized protein n=1 Tax=Salmonella phage IME207 TaxID=1873985 RepID=A0A1B1W2C2_9CAUD|nr:hypothetical protein BOW75_gp25 [Salmonella phage IME207]ANW46820.1 hypothetical protein [Salmonella phage IME207]
MSFCDITIAQRNANFTNIADTSAQLVSLNSDGSAVLKIGTETAQFIVQNLSQANAKQVLISTGSVLFFWLAITTHRILSVRWYASLKLR